MGARHHVALIRKLLAGLAVAYAAALGPVPVASANSPVVVTEEGPVRGVVTPTVRKFLGIPYATPPVGELRWRPPQPHARWRKPIDATMFANHCPQNASAFGLASLTEDCLFLNVFTPVHERDDDRDDDRDHGRGHHDDFDRDDDRDHGRAVMVWFHGGAHVVGESDDYDPTDLVDNGRVIVVTVNYRLGALGFLAHPALTAESPDHASGNYGLMDQQLALQWVQRNIHRFGGDRHRVTIFGESAGGLSVSFHLASPTAAGLFHGAIVESGAYAPIQPTLAQAEAAGTAFATRAGCPDQAACLRALTVAKILANQGGANPTVDGKTLTQSIRPAFASGQFNHVPVIEGANHDEWRLFVAQADLARGAPLSAVAYPANVAGLVGVAAAPLAIAQYPLASYPSPSLALSALGTDAIFDCPMRTAARLLSAFVPTFAYEFNDENAPQLFLPPVSFPYAAAHASELQYLFALRATVPAPALGADQEKLSDAMMRYWSTFARRGNPNSFGAPFWPPYAATTDLIQSLIPSTPVTEPGFAADHKCAFWATLGR